VAGSAGATVSVVIVQMIGPPLGWPGWVVDLSPFHHLAMVPAQAFALTPALVLLTVAALLAVAGLRSFAHRDLVGA
jgi:ABC-2 type transport system permease protein